MILTALGVTLVSAAGAVLSDENQVRVLDWSCCLMAVPTKQKASQIRFLPYLFRPVLDIPRGGSALWKFLIDDRGHTGDGNC
jgi:hypothetical protein